MDWTSLFLGAVLGVGMGIVGQNIIYPVLENRWRDWRRRTFYRKANDAWERFEKLYPRLALVQAGWDENQCFAESSVILRLQQRSFVLRGVAKAYRRAHLDEWHSQGYVDGQPVGISAISITRTSDDPNAELRGQAHRLILSMHRYRYLDFLATHILRLHGTAEERSALDEIAGAYGPDAPVSGFPTPCSIGLSVICESGAFLLLTRRTASNAGAYWEPRKVFNLVAENVALRDFAAAAREAREATPQIVARRGLYEELGFRDEDVQRATLRLHSFAWASDVLDFKFFGYIETPLSRFEVQDRWRHAVDRAETSGHELLSWPVSTADDCRALLSEIRRNSADWSPEAIFCTVRSLIVLRRVSIEDLSTAMVR